VLSDCTVGFEMKYRIARNSQTLAERSYWWWKLLRCVVLLQTHARVRVARQWSCTVNSTTQSGCLQVS